MRYLDFEKHIKKQFKGAEEPVQMDALLASLDLGKQPKRKGFAFWMIIPFLLLAAAIIGWGSLDNFTSSQSKVTSAYSSEQSDNQNNTSIYKITKISSVH